VAPHINYESIVPATTAAVSAVSSAVMQASGPDPVTPMLAMLVPIVSALIGGGVSYGILKGTVQAVKEATTDVKRDIHDIKDNVSDLVDRVSNIEGRIGRRADDGPIEIRR
jgi:Mor family transcriptional regulator